MRKSKLWLLIPSLAVAAALVASAPPPNLGKAVEAQKALAVERPGDDTVLNDLGNLLRMAGRLDEAEEAYRQALTIAPDKVPPRYNLALLLQQQGKRDKALEEFRLVVKTDPGFAWAHYQIGALLEEKGNESGALTAYAKAFALNPDLAFPQINPQVIDNELLTEALLKSYREVSAQPQAPNTYEDPERITELLVPPPAPSAAKPSERVTASSAVPPERHHARSPAPATSGGGSARPVSNPVASKVLTEDELAGRDTGQVTPLGPPVRGGGNRSTMAGTRGGGTTTWSWPRANQGSAMGGNAATAGSARSGAQKPSVVNPPSAPGMGKPGSAPGGFVPGTNSTGRLENRLLPGQPAAERVGP